MRCPGCGGSLAGAPYCACGWNTPARRALRSVPGDPASYGIGPDGKLPLLSPLRAWRRMLAKLPAP